MNGDDLQLQVQQPQPLQGIPNVAQAEPQQQEPDEDAAGTIPISEAPEHEELPPETMVVRGMYYGKNFGEHNHAANYGPEGQELQDDDVALSPNVADRLGLQRGDRIWVGNQLHTYNDVSAHTPTRPTMNSVEVRNYPLDGKIQIRKALPAEIEEHEKGGLREMPSALQASYMTGLDPSKITAQSINEFLQPKIAQGRGLMASTGDPTAAAVEDWDLNSLNQKNEVASQGLADENGEVTPVSMGLETGAESLSKGEESGPEAMIPVPDVRGMKYRNLPNGDIIYNEGQDNQIIGHRNSGIIEFRVGPQTVQRFPDGRTKSYETMSIYRDPSTGYTYNKNAPGMPRVVLEGQIPDMKPGVTGEAALDGLTEPQKNIVRMIGNYDLVLPPSAMRSVSFLPYLARVNAYTNGDYSMNKAVGRQQMIKSISNMSPNSAGYIITSANTMLEHLAQLDKAAQALPLGKWQKGNSFENFIKTNAGDPSVTNFQLVKTALLNELAKTLKGGVPDDTDMRRWENGLNASLSKDQMNDALHKDFPDILQGRLNGFRFLYQSVMDKPYEHTDPRTHEPITLISPKNQAYLKSIGYDNNVDAGDPVQQSSRQIQNIQAGLPPEGGADIQGARVWLAEHPNDPKAAQVKDLLIKGGYIPAEATPAPATASK